VEQYPKVLHPNKAMLEQLKNHMQEGAWWMTLGVARNHAKWERNKREKHKRRQDDQCIPATMTSYAQPCLTHSVYTVNVDSASPVRT